MRQWWLHGAGEEGTGSICHGYRISVGDDENVLDIGSPGVCLMPMNDTHRASMIHSVMCILSQQ